MADLTHVELQEKPLDPLATILDRGYLDRVEKRLRRAADRLDGHSFWNINSTAEGGGVAEMLGALLPYAVGAGWNVRWAVMFGDEAFYEVTKSLHNALHGVPADEAISDHGASEIYTSVASGNAEELLRHVRAGDVVVAHDPQAAGVISPLADAGAHVVWQCHVGTDTPNRTTRSAWAFLRPFVGPADRYVFSRADYLWDGLERERMRVIPPAIDALAPKNMPLDESQVGSILAAAGRLASPPTRTSSSRCRAGTGSRTPSASFGSSPST